MGWGLRGLEVYYRRFRRRTVDAMEQVCAALGLVADRWQRLPRRRDDLRRVATRRRTSRAASAERLQEALVITGARCLTGRRASLPMLELAPAAAPVAPVRPSDQLAEFATEDLALPRFHVWTLGCQMNHSDSEEMAGALLAAGCAEAAEPRIGRPDRHQHLRHPRGGGAEGDRPDGPPRRPAPRESRVARGADGLFRPRRTTRTRLHTRYPAGGPLPAPGRGARADRAPRPGESTAPVLTDVPGACSASATRRGNGGSLASHPGSRSGGGARARGSAISAWLPIIYGCDKTCTYCIVPVLARPRAQPAVRRRSSTRHVRSPRRLPGSDAAGPERQLVRPRPARRAALRATSTELGTWAASSHLDGRPDMAALLRAIDGLRTADGVPAISRLRFVTSHPWDLSDRLIAAMAECASVCEHLHLPVQSGDDAVLRRMGRQYTVEAVPGAGRAAARGRARASALTTDVIVGFCGETEAQFETHAATCCDGCASRRCSRPRSRRGPGRRRRGSPTTCRVPRRSAGSQALLDAPGADRPVSERRRGWAGRRRCWSTQRAAATSMATTSGERAVARVAGRNREQQAGPLRWRPELIGRLVDVRVEHAGPYALVGVARRLTHSGRVIRRSS